MLWNGTHYTSLSDMAVDVFRSIQCIHGAAVTWRFIVVQTNRTFRSNLSRMVGITTIVKFENKFLTFDRVANSRRWRINSFPFQVRTNILFLEMTRCGAKLSIYRRGMNLILGQRIWTVLFCFENIFNSTSNKEVYDHRKKGEKKA